MLLTHHIKYSKIAIDKLNIDRLEREQVMIGAKVNDLCEWTNEYQFFFPNKQEIQDIMSSRKELVFLEDRAIYQSHFGNLTSLHAMSKKPDEPASITKNELVEWFEFLNDVALGNKTIASKNKIVSDSVQISNMFTGETIKYRQIFDADDTFRIKYRALGMMLHLIQDAYTFSHCERDEKNKVVQFYSYKKQNKEKHTEGDDVQDAEKDTLLKQCKSCLENILNGNRYHYDQILSLSSNPQNSGGGIFV